MELKKSSEAAKKQRDEMRSTVKTAADSLAEALKRIVRKDAEPRKVSLDDILKEDNLVREEYGMRKLLKYPVILNEYKPTTKESTWKRLMGAEVIKEKGRLPEILAIYHEAEGFDPIDNLDVINAEVEQRCKELYPTSIEISDEDKKAVRKSVIQQMEVDLAGEAQGPKPEKREPEVKEEANNTSSYNKGKGKK